MYRFTNDPKAAGDGDMIVLRYQDAGYHQPVLTALEKDGDFFEEWGTVTTELPGITPSPTQVFIDHNVAADRDFVKALNEFMGEGLEEVSFGPFGTKTFAMRLSHRWEELCIPEEIFYGAES